MASKTYYIYQNGKPTQVTKETYHRYYQPIWSNLQKMKRKDECTCPRSKLCFCENDCISCKYNASKQVPFVQQEVDKTICYIESFDANDSLTKDEVKRIHKIISTLSEKDQLLCNCLMSGDNNAKIKEVLGYTGRDSAFYVYKAKTLAKFQDIFSEFKKI